MTLPILKRTESVSRATLLDIVLGYCITLSPQTRLSGLNLLLPSRACCGLSGARSMSKRSEVSYILAPSRYARYLSTGDALGLDQRDIDTCDKQLEAFGDFISCEPWKGPTTRFDPPMAEFVFMRVM